MAPTDVLIDLVDDMATRASSARLLNSYYTGDHPLPWVHQKVASKYAKLMAMAITNFPLLVVDGVKNRLRVRGFRLDSGEADMRVWTDVWQANSLDIYSGMVHQQALVTGTSYVSVWPDATGQPRIRGESCFEVMHDVDPADPMTVRSAVKVWADPRRKKWHARVFEPGVVTFMSADYYGAATYVAEPDFVEFAKGAKWQIDDVIDNPFGDTVPIVPFLNRPRMNGTGMGEFADILPLFDRVNTLTADLLLAAELAAFKIRWATGLDIPEDETGRQVEPFDVALDRLWVSENPETKFGTFDATPLDPYASAIDQAIHEIAAASMTPPTLLTGKVTNLSAESLKSMEVGLVQKVRERMMSFGESWEQVMRLGLTVTGDPRATLSDIETIWTDPENISEAQRVDALVKLSSIGLPWRAVMERWGATPQEIARWEAMRADDVFAKMLAAESIPSPAMTSSNVTVDEQPEETVDDDMG